VQRAGRLAAREGKGNGFALIDHLPVLAVFALE
jgi:hypothetical protein